MTALSHVNGNLKGVIAPFFSFILRWSLVAINTLWVGFGEKKALVLLFHTVLVVEEEVGGEEPPDFGSYSWHANDLPLIG